MDPEDQTYVFLNTISHLTTQASTMQFVTLKGKGVKKNLSNHHSLHTKLSKSSVKRERQRGMMKNGDITWYHM